MENLKYTRTEIAVAQLVEWAGLRNFADIEGNPRDKEKMRARGNISYSGRDKNKEFVPGSMTTTSSSTRFTLDELDYDVQVFYPNSREARIQGIFFEELIIEISSDASPVEIICLRNKDFNSGNRTYVVHALATPGQLLIKGPGNDLLMPVEIDPLKTRLEQSNPEILKNSLVKLVYQQ